MVVAVAVVLLAIGWIAFVFLRWPPRNSRADPKRLGRRFHWGVPFYMGGIGGATGDMQDGTGDDWGGGDWGGSDFGGGDFGGGSDSGGGGDGGSGGD
jgi:hypothetical protein